MGIRIITDSASDYHVLPRLHCGPEGLFKLGGGNLAGGGQVLPLNELLWGI